MPATAVLTPAPITPLTGALTAEQLSELYFNRAIAPGRVIAMSKEEGLPSHRVGRRHLYLIAEVEEWLRAREGFALTEAAARRQRIIELVDDAPELTDEQVDRIADLLTGRAK